MDKLSAEVTFYAQGHPNIRAMHKSTIEITRESDLTPRGDCIIAVKSEMACLTLPNEVKRLIRTNDSVVIVQLESDGVRDEIIAAGSDRLTLKSPISMVIRRSDFICNRTLAIRANKAAKDISRELISVLRKGARVKITIRVERGRAFR